MHSNGRNTSTILTIYNIYSSGFYHNSSCLSCNDAIVNLFGNIDRSNQKFIGYIKCMSIMIPQMIKSEKVLCLIKKWFFGLYAVCTVKYFGSLSDGSINLKELESESVQLIEIAKYLFSILHSNRKQKAYQESLPLQILSCIYSSVWDSTTSIMDLWVNIRLTKQFCSASTIYVALFENATRL